MQRYLVCTAALLIWASSNVFAEEEVLEYGTVQVNVANTRTWQYWMLATESSSSVGFEYRFVDEFNNEFFAFPGYRDDYGYHFTLEQWIQSARIEGMIKATVAELIVQPPRGQPYSGYVTIQGWYDFEETFHPLNISGRRPRGTELLFYPR